jgi:hypothetical protein
MESVGREVLGIRQKESPWVLLQWKLKPKVYEGGGGARLRVQSQQSLLMEI